MATLPKRKRKASSAGRRKNQVHPIAAAALNALSSSSDDDAPLIAKRTKKEPRSSSPQFDSDAAVAPFDEDDDDDDAYAPRRNSRNAKPGSAPKKPSPKGKRDGARTAAEDAWMESEDEPSPAGKASSRAPAPPRRDDLDRRRLKPCFEVGAAVIAAWWSDPLSKNKERSWFPGKVRARHIVSAGGPYGPTREYDVVYDDGDELNGVSDHLLFAPEDYEQLTMQHDGKSDWIGVKSVMDHDSNDLWAQLIGWYVATIDGEERPFSLLADALDAYDASVVSAMTWEELKPFDLNRPEKYSGLFERDSAPAGGGSKVEGRAGGKKARKGTASRKNSPQERKKVRSPAEGTPAATRQATATKGNPRPAHPPAASAYIGVSYIKNQRKYVAQKESEDATLHFLGYYRSEVDAALAVDKGAMLGAKEKCNFATRHHYENDVRAERAAAGRPADVDVKKRYATVVKQVGVYLDQIFKGVEIDGDVGNGSDTGQRTKNMTSVTEMGSKELNSERVNSTTTEALNNTESKSQRKQSKFTGVSYNKRRRQYTAQIGHHRKHHFLGYYGLQADGAMAYDQAVKLLREANRGKVNFKNRQDYLCARAKELKKNELGSESLAEITKKIQTHLLKIPPPCPELVPLNDAMSKKWARYLPSETGEEFLELYQKNVYGLLLSEELQRTEFDISVPLVTSKTVESVQSKNPDAFFKPIMEETRPTAGTPQLPCHSKSVSSNSNKHDDADSLSNNSAGSRASDVSGTGSLSPNNDNIERQFFKDFPIPLGCPILWKFSCNSFSRGIVISPPIHGSDGDTAYKIMPAKSSKVEPSTVIPAKALAFGLDCPVHVSSPSGSASHLIEGKILFCTPVPASIKNSQGSSFLYTILIIKEGNQFQVMNDVPSPRVRYRTEKDVLVPKKRDTDRIATTRRSHTTLSMANSNAASTVRGRLATSPEAIGDINSQTSSHKFFSLNSTITSVD